jgi:hypothetical protein
LIAAGEAAARKALPALRHLLRERTVKESRAPQQQRSLLHAQELRNATAPRLIWPPPKTSP